jgi:hypothetical protein
MLSLPTSSMNTRALEDGFRLWMDAREDHHGAMRRHLRWNFAQRVESGRVDERHHPEAQDEDSRRRFHAPEHALQSDLRRRRKRAP